MANQSIISVPPNVDDPVVLRRFLSRLIEQVDIIIGNRASSEGTYVAAATYNADIKKLNSEINTLQKTINAIQKVLDNSDLTITSDIKALQTSVNQLAVKVNTLREITAIKGAMLTFGVNASGDPIILVNFNVASAVHSATGVYTISLTQATLNTQNILSNSVKTYTFKPSVTGLYQVNLAITGAAMFTLTIYTVTMDIVTGNPVLTAYNMQTGDGLEFSAIFNLPGTTLPSEF